MLLKNAGVREQLFCKAEMAQRGVAQYFDLARECWTYNPFVDVIIPNVTGHVEADVALSKAGILSFRTPVEPNRDYACGEVSSLHFRVRHEGSASQAILVKHGLGWDDCFCEET